MTITLVFTIHIYFLDTTIRSKTPTEQSVMRDIFAENVHKSSSRPTSAAASRRNSMSSLKQEDVEIINNFNRGTQKNSKGDIGARSSFRTPRKSTSSLGRTESYRQARGDFKIENEDIEQDEYEAATQDIGARAGKGRNKKYNSLPRLSSKKRDGQTQNMPNQNNLGPVPNRAVTNSRPNSRNGPPKKGECIVM